MSKSAVLAEHVEIYGLRLLNWGNCDLVCAGQICSAQVRRADMHVMLLQAGTTEGD